MPLKVRRGFSVFLIVALIAPPGYAAQIVLDGPPEAGKMAKIGKIEGKIIRADSEGIYVKVSKKDVKDNRDFDTGKMIELFTDKEWDERYILLFIPNSELFKEPVTEPVTQGDESEKQDGFDCYLEGKQRARSTVSTGGSWAGGFLGGFFLGLIGTGIAVIAQSEPTVPYHELSEVEGDCRIAFMEGYGDKGKGKKRTAALTGGLVGTAVLVVILVASSSGN